MLPSSASSSSTNGRVPSNFTCGPDHRSRIAKNWLKLLPDAVTLFGQSVTQVSTEGIELSYLPRSALSVGIAWNKL
jgi:hypothetical protein